MGVKQISVFVENTAGTLYRLTDTLGKAGVDMMALSVADTENYGIVRIIADDTEKGVSALHAAGYAAKLTDVLAVCVPDRPGGLAFVLGLISDAGIFVDYLYSFFRTSGEDALIILRSDRTDEVEAILKNNDVRMLDQDELDKL